MSERLQQTREMLARHHRDGERFAQMMKEGFANRFNEAFWESWQQWMEPVFSDRPVVVDLGSRPGMFLQALAERYPDIRAVGVECAPYMLDAAVELPPSCELLCADLHDPRLPLESSSVDAVMASVVLHEMTQPVRALQEMRRLLRPGGRMLILDWVRAPLDVYIRAQTEEAQVFGDVPLSELEDLFVHFIEHNRFSRDDLTYLLNHTGFSVIDTALFKEGRYARIVAERRA